MTSRRVKPPPIPDGEDPYVTIGNQENQIDLLCKRVAELERLKTTAETLLSHKTADVIRLSDELETSIKKLDDARISISWSEGYIARVKEEDNNRRRDF